MAEPLVGVVMGSKSDWDTMTHASATLDELGIPHQVRVMSAHRTPDVAAEYAETAEDRGLELIQHAHLLENVESGCATSVTAALVPRKRRLFE